MLAIAILFSVPACGDPPLGVWHTEKLTEEFTAETADNTRTLDDYRRLEDTLFADLEEKVYSRRDRA